MDQPIRPVATRRVSLRAAGVALGIAGLTALASVGAAAGATSIHKPRKVVISTTKNAGLGTILVSGKTLYTLKASKTPCTAQCLKVWPAVLLPKDVKAATAGSGVSAKKLGTVKRAGGARQVTYSGKALYWFSGDRTVGQAAGNVTNQWGKWSAVVTVGLSTTSTSQLPPPSATTAPSASATPSPASPPQTSPPPTNPPPTSPPPTTPPPTTATTAPSTGGASF
jgi:predicted lipoprotein with Yx(FWY)xxD motif